MLQSSREQQWGLQSLLFLVMYTFIFLPNTYCDLKLSRYYLTPMIKIHSIFHFHFQIYIVKTLNWTHEKCMAILIESATVYVQFSLTQQDDSWFIVAFSNSFSPCCTCIMISWLRNALHLLPYVLGIYYSLVDSHLKGQLCRTLMFTLYWPWMNCWTNS